MLGLQRAMWFDTEQVMQVDLTVNITGDLALIEKA